VLDATDGFAHFVTDDAELKGIPDDDVEAARNAAEKDGKPGWKFTLHAPSYLPVMQYADNRALRELMYRASATRASEFGKPELDNTPLITEIVNLRRELAQLLDFESYAAYSLEPKMADTPAQVMKFLEDLGVKAKPFAQRDLDELKAFARAKLNMPALEAWDIGYASEKLRAAQFAFSDQEVKQYFPETRVLPGMFRVIETIYGLSIREEPAPVWHPDVRFFGIYDDKNQPVGRFYLDLYARQAKRGGAWMDEVMARRRTASGIQTPVAYLNCNFSPPVGESGGKKRPALFTHDEVITDAGRRAWRFRHQRRRVGCGRTAQPVHGKLLLGMARARADDGARRYRCAAAARVVRQDAGGEKFPERHADRAPDRIFTVRHAAASPCQRHQRPDGQGCTGCRTTRVRSADSTRLQPLSQQLQPHFCRRLRRRLLQLQMG
jgi:hypothetical protein